MEKKEQLHQKFSHHSVKFNNLKGSLILVGCALIWGFAFVAQDDASTKGIAPFTFNFARSLIGSLFMALLILVRKVFLKQEVIPKESKDKKELVIAGILLGICLFGSLTSQQYGISLYPEEAPVSARSGFLSTLYVIIVPLLSPLFHRKVPPFVWVATLVAGVGVYVLSISGNDGHFYLADIVTFGCPIFYSFQILVVDRYSGKYDGMLLSFMQFFFFSILSAIFMLIFELPQFDITHIFDGIWDILYLGILSSGIAYTLQIIGQRYASPAVSSLTMSLEGVFATIGGVLIMGDTMKTTEIIGCVLLFVAIVLAQMPDIFKAKEKKQTEEIKEANAE